MVRELSCQGDNESKLRQDVKPVNAEFTGFCFEYTLFCCKFFQLEGDHGGDLPLPRQFNLFVNYPGNYIRDGTIPFEGFRPQKENLARTIAKSDYPMKGKLISYEPTNRTILARSSKSVCDLHSRDLLAHDAYKRSTNNTMSIMCGPLNESSIASF